MATRDTVLAKILIDDQTKLGFNSYARNVERAKKTSEAFRKNAIDKVALGLETQVQVLKKSAKELDLLTAANHGASQAQLDHISTLHQAIDAHKRDAAAQEEASRQTKLKADQDMRAEEITARAIQQLNFEGDAAGQTADDIQILRLRMQGLNDEQIESVRVAQEATAGMRGVGNAAGNASKGGLRIMRGGFGQLGHQIQDISVQLQMGQNALLVFGQQGSQIASLFGQNGALIGALLAVGAAIGTTLAPKLFSSKSAMDELKKSAELTAKILEVDFLSSTAKVTKEFAKLSKESKELAEARIQIALVTSIKAAELAMKDFGKAASDLRLSDALGGTEMHGVIKMGDSFAHMSKQLNVSKEEAKKLQTMFFALGQGGSEAAIALADYTHKLVSSRDASDKKNHKLVEINSTLRENVFAVKDAATKEQLLKDILNGTNKAYKDSTKAVDDATKAKEDATAAFAQAVQEYERELIALEKGEEALIRHNLASEGVKEGQINLVMALRKRVKNQEESNRVTDEAAAKEKALAESKRSFVEGVVAQADALGNSNIELLQANALTDQLSETQRKAFDAAIKRLKEFQDAQEKSQKVESAKGKLESLRQSLLTEEQVLKESMVNQNMILVENLALGVINEREFRDYQLQVLEDFNEKKKALLDKGISDELEGMSFLQKATIEGAKRLEDFNKLSATEQTQHVLGELGSQFDGIAKNNKKLFAISKAFNIANAVMNTATAATVAYKSYPPPLNYVMAGGVIAAGLGQVAQIKAQSFDGGGFTGSGGRSGGMDGKGGFPAILHPNETVIDHTKGQNGGVTIVNNIDASGADANVDMKIRAAMQQTSQQTVASIQDLMRRRRFI